MKRITVPLLDETAQALAKLAEQNRRGIGPQIAFMLEAHFSLGAKSPRKRKARQGEKTAA